MSVSLSRVPNAEEWQAAPALDPRVHAAVLRCIARWGTAKTTLDDVAREAGVSRATVYRQAPGGREALFQAVGEAEVAALLDAVVSVLAEAPDLEEALVGAIVTAGTALRESQALAYLVAYEPERILPAVTFAGLDRLLGVVAAVTAPTLVAHVDGDLDHAGRVSEWAARLTVSYLLSPAASVDLTDAASVRTLVTDFVLPGLTPRTNRRTA